jgi:hypothetical protein
MVGWMGGSKSVFLDCLKHDKIGEEITKSQKNSKIGFKLVFK